MIQILVADLKYLKQIFFLLKTDIQFNLAVAASRNLSEYTNLKPENRELKQRRWPTDGLALYETKTFRSEKEKHAAVQLLAKLRGMATKC
jgi:hypothetical protein